MFSDIQNHWAKECILQLAQRNIISGYPNGTYRPDVAVTRAEFAVLMGSIFSKAPTLKPAMQFKDVPTNHWAFTAIKTAVEKGFFSGYPDQTFKPDQPIPRIQALIALAAHLKFTIPKIFTLSSAPILPQYFEDAAEIPDYAKPKIQEAIFGSIIVNYPQVKKLRPNQNTTRGEAAAFLSQALGIANAVPKQYIVKGSVFVIEPQFDAALNFSEGLAAVVINHKSRYINPTGAFAFAGQYELADSFSEGLAGVRINGKWGYIDQTGQVVIAPQFEYVYGFVGGFALTFRDGKGDYINKKGQIVSEPQLSPAPSPSDGLVLVKLGDKYGYTDAAGQVMIPPEFEEAQPFSEGLAAVKIQDKWGYINPQGEVVIQPQFYKLEYFRGQAAYNFSEGLALVRFGETCGFINSQGEMIFAPEFKDADSFFGGLARVNIGGVWIKESIGYDSSAMPIDFETTLRGGKWGYIGTRNAKVNG